MKKFYTQPEVMYCNFHADVIVMSVTLGDLGNDGVLSGGDIEW